MDKTFAYYPGCALHGSAREYDVSTRLVCWALGVELRDIKDWVCCGASSAHARSRLLSVTLPATTLVAAGKMGLPVLAPCAMCFARFRHALREIAKAPVRAQVSEVLGEEVGELSPVYHPLQVLDHFTPQVDRLQGLRVACYYGCLLVRPVKETGIDDAEDPTLMDRLVARLGGEAVPWAFKAECCGGGMSVALPDMVKSLSSRLQEAAHQAGAQVVVVTCPMCQANLDLYPQGEGKLPVLYITQLVGLALGLSPKELMVDRLRVSPLPLLREKGLVGKWPG